MDNKRRGVDVMSVLQQLLAIGSSVPSPPLNLLSDPFTDGVLDAVRWTKTDSGGTTVSETANGLEIQPTANTSGYGQIQSNYTGDLTNGYAELEFVQLLGANTASGYNGAGDIYLRKLGSEADNYIAITFNNQSASIVNGNWTVRTNGVNNSSSNGYNIGSTFPRRFRILMSGTSCLFQIFSGGAWSTVVTKTVSWDVSQMVVLIQAGYWGTGNASTQKGIFKNFVWGNDPS